MANLLLIDDDLDLADALAEVLRVHGHGIRVARNGREGLARLAEERPDLIICDVEMPILSGPDMALRIFIHDAGDELVPIVLTSGVPDLRRVAANVGTPYFLRKPFTADALFDTLDQALTERTPPSPKYAREGAS